MENCEKSNKRVVPIKHVGRKFFRESNKCVGANKQLHTCHFLHMLVGTIFSTIQQTTVMYILSIQISGFNERVHRSKLKCR